ncbi:ATPase family AAA domain-containing protein 2 isoform X6 [Ochotona curzoniae]|uniref:ATPase family AAA domain-containing protein 2 isoform X6 n=1 Tax=Ochotona curzoniae TaxID=130825 RepID=UPI001B35109F|nr:ATPase family AAA domain-containing protein 2 isoform X6 [Ochotona curzoniae]
MVVLRSSLELHGHSAASATDSLDLSNEFVNLEQLGRRRLRSARAEAKSAVPAAGADDGSSVKEVETYHQTRALRSLRKTAQDSSDSSFDKNMEITEKRTNGRHFTSSRDVKMRRESILFGFVLVEVSKMVYKFSVRIKKQLARQQADKKKEECKEDKVIPVTRSLRTRNIVQTTEHLPEENGDVEVRRSCRIRSRYGTVNQSVLFDKLITNTAEAVLQKMDDMKKMRRQRMRGLGDLTVFDEAAEGNLNVYARGKQKRIQRADEETTDNQEGSVESSEEGDDQEDEDDGEDDDDDDDDEEEDEEDGEEDNQQRYYLRQRKATVYYQAPLEKPRHQRKPNIFYSGPTSPARQRYRLSSAGPRSPYCKRMNRRRHAIHSSDSTSSSSEDEQQFERRRKRSRNRAINRCLPLNFRKDELKGIYKDRMKIGASLADVDPMQLDSSVRFDSVGGLSNHIAALKEMVVFPLLYPEVFEKFKIQPPRGCLFYGPPGTGKTLVARALANECSQGDKRVAFFMRKGADCLSKWVGESERQLRLLFDQAYQMRPSIIFFDEIDGLAPVRSSRQDQIHSSIVSTLLALMDGLDSRGEIVVIGATNRLDSIDPALRRPGRFDREFLFTLPDKDARKEILKIHTRDWHPKPLDTFLDELAENCVGYCGADIKSICAEAALCALRRRYPQIYTTSEKLQLDLSSINISAKDFELPGKEERTKFFEDLILKQAAKPPVSKKKAVLQALEVLPVAPPPEPEPLTAEEMKRLEEQEEDTFRELRIFLRNVTHRLAIDKRFRIFTKPVDPDEVPDYVTVIKQPMDLSSVISKIDLHKYLTVKDYLRDIDLICSNALEYNPDRDPGDRLIRHRACALRDTAYAIIKEELDEDFEQLCEEIQESRKKRGCISSKYAPSYYHVMPKQNSILAGDKRSEQEHSERLKVASPPVACSTPAQLKRKIRKKSRWYLGTITKRRKISQAKEDSQSAVDKIESDLEEMQETSVDPETGNTGESSLEDSEKLHHASEDKVEVENHSSTSNTENELEESRKTAACMEFRKEKIVCNGDASSSQIVGASDENEAKEMSVLRMTRARRSQVEQQQLISVEKALEILSQPTPSLVVDHERLKNLLKTVVKKSQEYNILQLENLYAVISQCIYQHRRDYDKTTLIQKMEQEVEDFSCSRS